jgi:predicted  nucleic acid-binding Zn-ribbon protein
MVKQAIKDLLILQAEDLRIRDLKTRLMSIPRERAALVAEFDVVRKGLEKAKQNKLKVEQAVKQQAAATKDAQEKLQALKIKSSSIKKINEYNAILAEIEAAKKNISDSETREIELMDEQEAADKLLAKAERSYKATGRTVQAEVRELDSLKEAIAKEIEEKEKRSAELAKNVVPNYLEPYRRMLAAGKGSPVGTIRNGSCSNCNMKNSPQTTMEARNGNLVNCDNCSFYLYDPEA